MPGSPSRRRASARPSCSTSCSGSVSSSRCPARGVNPYYGGAALVGIIVIGIAAFLVIGIMEGQKRAESIARWVARKLRTDPDKMAAAIRQIGTRLEDLVSDRALLKKVVIFALLNWLVDAASLWVFLRAFGGSLDLDALIVSFGLANLLAAVPITPGGLGYVDLAYLSTLVGFGLSNSNARLGIASYRLAQFFFPILIGGLSYLSLRVGPGASSDATDSRACANSRGPVRHPGSRRSTSPSGSGAAAPPARPPPIPASSTSRRAVDPQPIRSPDVRRRPRRCPTIPTASSAPPDLDRVR